MKKYFSQRRFFIVLPALLLLVGAGVFWYAKTAFGVTRTWDGGGVDGTCGGAGTANNWTCAANWTGDTAPTGSDIASFDGTSTKDATINANISVAGINIAAGYSGTITQSSTYTVTVGSSHFVQAAGTFTGGSGAITLNGTFTLSAGTFTSTSGILQIGRDIGADDTVFTVSGGTFNHNNGTVKFVSYSFYQYTYTVDVAASLTLYNIDVSVTSGTQPPILSTAAGDTIIAANNFTHTDGVLDGTWEVQGNVIIGASADGGAGTLTYTGTGSKTYTYIASGTGPHLRVNNAGISVSANGGTTDLKVALFSLLAGTFMAPSGTMTIGRWWTAAETVLTVSGGTFNHNNGTVKFIESQLCYAAVTFTVDVMTTLTLYNIDIDSPEDCGYLRTITPAAGDTIIAANNFTQTNGALAGTWEVHGNVIIGASADGGAGTLTMTGTGSKTYTYTASGTGSHLRVNNAGISVSANGGTADLKVALFSLLAGTFMAPSGTMTIGQWRSTPETILIVSGGTFNHNNGTVKFIESQLCYIAVTFTVDVMTTLTLYNVEVAMPELCGYRPTLTTAAGDTIIVTSNFIQTDGLIAGTWEVQGNYTVATTADGGTAGITFTGGNTQTYTDNGGDEPNGDVTVNKSGGTVTLASNADWNAASQDLTITAGTLSSATYNIATTNFTVNGGTFTGGSGTLTTAGPMLVSSGTFTGGAGNITINNIYTLSGGIFTAPSGTLQIGRDIGADDTVFTVSGGTFNHNNGTVKFTSNGYYTHTYTLDVPTSLTLYNIDSSVTCGYVNDVSTLSPASGDTIIAAGNFIQTDGALAGTWEAQGNVIIGAGADGGGGTLTMTGTGSKTYTYTASGTGAHLRVNNAGISVSANGGTTGLKVTLFSLLAGTFTAPTGTLEIGRNAGISETVLTVSGGTFNHNNGTVKFSSNGYYTHTYTVDVSTSLTLYNIDASLACGYVNDVSVLSLTSGDTIIAAGNFIQTDGALNGTWEVQGNYTVATTADGGSTGITFTGGNNQTYTDQGGNEPDGNITINKTANGVTLASNADWNAASQDLTITAGTLLQSSNYAVATGAVTVGASGKWVNNGTGAVTLGGAVANSGLIDFRSSNTCGGSDTIALHSSSNGVQRAWSGAGTFVMRDIEVKDQGGSAAITADSSTNTSGNGGNWTFSGAACPAVPTPKAGLPSGYTRLQGGKVNLR